MASRFRRFARVAPAVALLLAAVAKPASGAVPDIVVYCDPTLAHAMRDTGSLFTARNQAPVHVFSAPPTLMLAQLARHVQNDVLVTETSWMDRAESEGLIQSGTRVGGWRNRLVIARQAAAEHADEAFALTDPTPAATIDGPAVIAALGLKPARKLGAANSSEVAFLLDTGAASRGLLHLTDVRADPALAVAEPVAEGAYQPIIYAAAMSGLARSPNARGFLEFLRSPEAAERLQADGLETAP